ncbi:MAG: tetratricopeptide repeat protein [Desulfobacterales bacterium]|nr:tetratricopeptide repeat protein [Desulfobacterales bacterium]
MRRSLFIMISIFIMIFSGCSYLETTLSSGSSFLNVVQGEYYLDTEKYREGIEAFKKDLENNPDDPKVHYYLGRFYIAENYPKQSLKHMKKAVKLDASNAEYHFWLGIVYSANKNRYAEQKSYEKALKLDPDHVQSRIYLAHTQLEGGHYTSALKNYSIVLEDWPDEPASLYNRAFALNKLRRKKEEKPAWKEYLDFYPSGPMARRATDHLNSLGDFSYRNHLIGKRTITLRKIQFKPGSDRLTPEDKESLAFLGSVLRYAKDVSIHIVAYKIKDKQLAEKRAKSIKMYLLGYLESKGFHRLKVSWFDVSERIRVDGRIFTQDESVNFITAVSKKRR